MSSPVQPESNDLAIASLVLGIVSLVGGGVITGIPAIITGILALRKNQLNKSMAVAGIITGTISVIFALLILLGIILLIIFGIFAGSALEDSPKNFDDEAPESSLYQRRA